MSICFVSHPAKPCTHVALFNHDCEITDRLLVHDIAVEDHDRLGILGKRALKPCGGCTIEQEKPRKRVQLPGRPGSIAEIMKARDSVSLFEHNIERLNLALGGHAAELEHLRVAQNNLRVLH
jgi:hypothetical protein